MARTRTSDGWLGDALLDAPVDVLYAKGHEESKTSDDGCTSQDADDNLEHVDTETMTAERHEGNKTPADGRDALPSHDVVTS